MNPLIRSLLTLTIAGAALGSARASVVVTEFHQKSLVSSSSEPAEGLTVASESVRTEPSELGSSAVGPAAYALYPVAGTSGDDMYIPYYVDLDPGAGVRDFNCTAFSFDGHTGQDPYIRSFREQEIGVPVFTPLDGLVVDVHDGEPDQNTEAREEFKSNYVVIDHSEDHRTVYLHLKKGSITVTKGERVTAGTQIAEVGSSGPSTAPHIHFEARYLDEPFEPYAGPCRPGAPFFSNTPVLSSGPVVVGASFSGTSYGTFRSAPFDDAPHTGTFPIGAQTIYFKTELANVPAGSAYVLTLRTPSGRTIPGATGTLASTATSRLDSFWWGVAGDFEETGTWNAVLDVNGHRVLSAPFSVVTSPGLIVNRPPAPITASIEPVGIQPGEVAVCRAASPLFSDPDYDVVSYHYQWRVNDEVVRDVTTAATSDAIPRQYSLAGNRLSCSITASDGEVSGTTVTANATIATPVRRRGISR